MDDEGTSTGPDAPSDPSRDPSETPEGAREDPHGATASGVHGSRVPLLIGIVVAVLAIGAMGASALVRDIGPSLPETFKATEAIPYSVEYPEGWKVQDSGFGFVVISPLSDLGSRTPEQFAALLEQQPETVVAMQLFGVGTDEEVLPVAQQPGLELASDDDEEVDGYPARRIVLAGKVFQSAPGQGPDEEGELTLWLVDLGKGRMTLLGFVSSAAAEDASLFDAMVETVEFDQAKLDAIVSQPVPDPAAAPTAAPPTAAPTAVPPTVTPTPAG
ncbi:MAG: hypothetical protein WEA10_04580 [Actinomycetota bacterium]